ncbi:polyprenyl diphosphate synthase [Marinomonas communis]|uniref:Ditrans,polycis-undecaprenyl-diphosphate synthase ((2E,6E)-farnesyl-diphosphate specific) n=1 Tax=Marinomonas communis TaxID=28254 RepID=A0A4R6X5Y6_9GAMM|nr:polyprenyl diphosphate synthase [Marinomonas communis]TDR12327.1 undecaprenyl pyrophosphate synthetase [Marinomonas communis]
MSNQILTNDGRSLPAHVAIIMDGNNRWAKKKFLPSIAGHRAGALAVRKTVESAAKCGVKVLTLFAFSSENWKRPQAEVDGLMGLFMRSLKKETKRLNEHSIRLIVVGDKSGFSKGLQDQIERVEQVTAQNTGMVLAIAANYGGRWDIAQAAKKMAEQVAAGEIEPDQVTEETLGQHVCLAGLPELDLIIRTSGEERVSNFLLWQLAYAEFVFMPVLWPDFTGDHFEEALAVYQQRQRRYGGR